MPNIKTIIDYFRWRNEDAYRNALNAYCCWMLRKQGLDKNNAANFILGKSVQEKNELLFTLGINYNTLPNWQKRGVGIYWEKVIKTGYDIKNGTAVTAERNILKIDFDLPIRDEYNSFIEKLVCTL